MNNKMRNHLVQAAFEVVSTIPSKKAAKIWVDRQRMQGAISMWPHVLYRALELATETPSKG